MWRKCCWGEIEGTTNGSEVYQPFTPCSNAEQRINQIKQRITATTEWKAKQEHLKGTVMWAELGALTPTSQSNFFHHKGLWIQKVLQTVTEHWSWLIRMIWMCCHPSGWRLAWSPPYYQGSDKAVKEQSLRHESHRWNFSVELRQPGSQSEHRGTVCRFRGTHNEQHGPDRLDDLWLLGLFKVQTTRWTNQDQWSEP